MHTELLEDIRIQRSKALAFRAHKGQKRKYGDEPYINHPQRVAEGVMRWGKKKNTPKERLAAMVCAAWGHDVIEDCPQISEDELREAAGDLPVLNIVKELTNPSKRLKSLPRAQRKEIDRQHLKQVSFEAKIIKLIDRLDNLEDMERCDDPEFALLYAKESEMLLESIGDVDPELVDAIQKQIEKLRELCKVH